MNTLPTKMLISLEYPFFTFASILKKARSTWMFLHRRVLLESHPSVGAAFEVIVTKMKEIKQIRD